VSSLQYYVPLSDRSNIYTVLYRPSRLRKEGWLVCLLDGEEDTYWNIVRYDTDTGPRAGGVSLRGALSESRGEVKRRRDYEMKRKEEDGICGDATQRNNRTQSDTNFSKRKKK